MDGKLVRDEIPRIIEKNEGVQPRVTVLQEFLNRDAALRDKLVEEAKEVQTADNKACLIEELADLEEVVRAR